MNFFHAVPVAERVRIVGAEHETIVTDFASQVFQGIDVVDQRIEIEVFQISARRVGRLRRPNTLTSYEFFVKAPEMYGKKPPPWRAHNFKFGKRSNNPLYII